MKLISVETMREVERQADLAGDFVCRNDATSRAGFSQTG